MKKMVIYKIHNMLYGLKLLCFSRFTTKKKRQEKWKDYEKYRENIVFLEEYFAIQNPNTEEEKEIFQNIEKKGITNVFPYEFVYKYFWIAAWQLYYDKDAEMFYAKINKKRLYLKHKERDKALSYYYNLILEQDKKSPHLYWDKKIEGDYLFDCGTAEGIFALTHIDEFDHIYIFEADESWLPALNKTFEYYKDKITIIQGFLSNVDTLTCIKLDTFLDKCQINISKKIFIKMDVEGSEIQVLEGAKKSIDNFKNIQMAICTYHNQNDEKDIYCLLESYKKFIFSTSNGYMLLYYDKILKEPYLRRGILRVSSKKIR